jgi:GNAT superfamily N-acetyltransferase
MILRRTDNLDKDFITLTTALDAHFNVLYGALQKQYSPHNIMSSLKTVLVGYEDKEPIACGCFRVFEQECVEIKRMYVSPKYRQKGYASMLLYELENWAKELGYKRALLELGNKQPQTLKLYESLGYLIRENYGVYKEIETSICMEKML